MPRLICLLLLTTLLACDNKPSDTRYNWPLREGFPRPQVPKDNPMTAEKVTLGRHLFYDKNLSFNKTQSCASCHTQKYAFAETKKQSTGSTGEKHRRNAPALVNIAYNKTLTWAHDGLKDIETQLLLPMFGESPVELGITGHEAEVLARFKTSLYTELFEQAFPDKGLSFNTMNQALASFVRSLISLNSPFDRYAYDGDDSALSESALKGMTLFFSEKFECHHCHGGFNFTQSTFHEKQLLDRRPFHNTGLYNSNEKGQYPIDDGLYEVTLDHNDHGRFRAPTLRNIEVTAPYMHDGSIDTLEQVIEFYAAGGRLIEEDEFQGDGRKNPLKSPFVKGFEITEEEKNDLIAFMQSLTDQEFLISEKHSKPTTN
ncbi:MbnH family di-heme enzyme [Pleionea mediterranea]|uniref:Cytochrome c peroxidase n=1 Tax=Pleionea mediterranea TaxID=523701 RepID=A0A316G6J0_9GAMM|nr:MbnH family di-heme enzyme [Pleionea mediterranea]PWK50067.1 cytochrome c peroxidase [Pleionea mediterranea]